MGEADLLRHRTGSLLEALVAVSGHFLHGVRSVDRFHVLRGVLGNPAFHGTDFGGLDPERAAVHLRLSLQVALTNSHPRSGNRLDKYKTKDVCRL